MHTSILFFHIFLKVVTKDGDAIFSNFPAFWSIDTSGWIEFVEKFFFCFLDNRNEMGFGREAGIFGCPFTKKWEKSFSDIPYLCIVYTKSVLMKILFIMRQAKFFFP